MAAAPVRHRGRPVPLVLRPRRRDRPDLAASGTGAEARGRRRLPPVAARRRSLGLVPARARTSTTSSAPTTASCRRSASARGWSSSAGPGTRPGRWARALSKFRLFSYDQYAADARRSPDRAGPLGRLRAPRRAQSLPAPALHLGRRTGRAPSCCTGSSLGCSSRSQPSRGLRGADAQRRRRRRDRLRQRPRRRRRRRSRSRRPSARPTTSSCASTASATSSTSICRTRPAAGRLFTADLAAAARHLHLHAALLRAPDRPARRGRRAIRRSTTSRWTPARWPTTSSCLGRLQAQLADRRLPRLLRGQDLPAAERPPGAQRTGRSSSSSRTRSSADGSGRGRRRLPRRRARHLGRGSLPAHRVRPGAATRTSPTSCCARCRRSKC